MRFIFATLLWLFSITLYSQTIKSGEVKNIILMIGDGMGLSQIQAGLTANKNQLQLERCNYIGLAKTYSADNYITDSAASGTALATGNKTANGYIATDTTGKPLETILEKAESHQLATGMVVTCAVVHATPASFIAHNKDRHQYEEIAIDFLETPIDVLIGGGKKFFSNRSDNLPLLKRWEEKNYKVYDANTELPEKYDAPFVILTDTVHPPTYTQGRGNYLVDNTKIALNTLSKNEKGFFLMIESSQIDWGGHANDKDYVVSEMLDFDRTIGTVFDFADKNEGTLVIITADHECGGMTVLNGNYETGGVEATFAVKSHTGTMVPVFAYGKNAKEFSGIYENTEIFNKMMQLYGFRGKK